MRTSVICDTDTHTFTDLGTAGARTWTASPTGDAPSALVPANVAQAVVAGKAVGGQGVYVQTRLVSATNPVQAADLTWDGSTHVSDPNGQLDLEIRVQAPTWAEYDQILIYAECGDGAELRHQPVERESVRVQRDPDCDAQPRDELHAQRRPGGGGPRRRSLRDELDAAPTQRHPRRSRSRATPGSW